MNYLLEICEFLAIPGTNPQRFVAHRWLSAYDAGINTRRMLPAYKVLHFGFHSQAHQTLYQEVLEEIFKDHHVGECAKARIQLMHQDLKKKGNTEIDNCFIRFEGVFSLHAHLIVFLLLNYTVLYVAQKLYFI